MIGGWFVGKYSPSAIYTDCCEVGFKIHPKGERWPIHYHANCDETNLVLGGKMEINGRVAKAGDIFVIPRNIIAQPRFLEDCYIVVIKTPNITGDKIEC